MQIPLSDVGFLPGKLKHTNEFMVFLGDGYFVERTAHECYPIISRRIDKLKSDLSKIETLVERDRELQETIEEQKANKELGET